MSKLSDLNKLIDETRAQIWEIEKAKEELTTSQEHLRQILSTLNLIKGGLIDDE